MILGAADLSDPRFLSNLSPSDLYLVVTQGIGSMPAWQARLSQNERWDVIDYLRTFTYDPSISAESALPTQEQPEASRPECEPYVTQTNPFEWGQADAVSAGLALYASCAGCHGEDGSGGAPGAPDFTSPVFQGNLRSNSGEILCSLAEGLNAMPGWKEALSEEQMWQLLTYIGNLGP
jgi:mono/diheme cytochrome c family protein